jgi:aryl-alcohol dehydrogenase-like predicted oxidoreductase
MRYIQFGKTDLSVPAVSLGTAPLGDMFGAADESEAIAAVHRALDAAINFSDSSPYYGAGLAERRLESALRARRGHVVIGTKAGRYGRDEFDFSPCRLRESLHRSLELLQTHYVDILQLHDVTETDLDVVLSYAHYTPAQHQPARRTGAAVRQARCRADQRCRGRARAADPGRPPDPGPGRRTDRPGRPLGARRVRGARPSADVRSLSWSSGLPGNNGGDTCSA